MAARKSMANMLLESKLHTSPNSSSPLRRKSVAPKSDSSSALLENDDEAERLARRRRISIVSTPTSGNVSDKRRSLGLGFLAHMPPSQMAERISQCIKLGTENKINPKNAFSLEIIDFMTYMIKKQDANMSNLQVASSSLDVSTKIYGFRVDGVHTQILNMIGGLDKQEKADMSNNTNEADEQVDGETGQVKKVKKKRKSKQKTFVTVESLKANVEIVRPSTVSIEEEYSQTTDMLYQAMLPNHAHSKFYLYPYNDVQVDTVETNVIHDTNVGTSVLKLDNISQLEICPSLFSFDFHNWDIDDEQSCADAGPQEEHRDSGFQFDIDASLPINDVPPIPSEDYFNLEDIEEDVERCMRAPNEVENITDFREVLTAVKPAKALEYSFVQESLHLHWAGPSHWKATHFKKPLSTSRVVETCRQGPNRKRREIELSYKDEGKTNITDKFKRRISVKLLPRTAKFEWNEETLTLPPDQHYDIKCINKLFLHSLKIRSNRDNCDSCDANLPDVAENDDFIDGNDLSNDFPMVNNDTNCGNNQMMDENNCSRGDAHRLTDDPAINLQSYAGDNLVAAPKLTCKSRITYSSRAKNIDMKQLKKCIWTSMISESNEKNKTLNVSMNQDKGKKIVNSIHFSKTYKQLPSMLTKSNVEALSFPIAFVSLLHLANEKSLKITALPDLTDLIIEDD